MNEVIEVIRNVIKSMDFNCEYPNCKEKGTGFAERRNPDGILWVCEKHSKEIDFENCSEYREWCPVCGCQISVN